MIKELVKKNRSCRRFYQEKKLTRQQLMELVEVARLTPSAANRQPFKYKKEIKTFFEQNSGIYSAIWFNCCDLANCGYIMKQAKKAGIKKRIIHAHNNQLMHTGKKRKFYELVHNYWKNNIDRYATDYWACSELAGEFFYKKSILESDNYRIINKLI